MSSLSSSSLGPQALAEKLELLHHDLVIAADKLVQLADRVRAGKPVDRPAAEQTLETALLVLWDFRDLASRAVTVIPGTDAGCDNEADVAGLVTMLCGELRKVADARGRKALQSLSDELQGGGIEASAQSRRRTLETFRQAAIVETRDALSRKPESVATFPGPAYATSWLGW